MRRGATAAALVAAAALGACASSPTPPDVGLTALALRQVGPPTIVPGTQLRITGSSFVPADWGTTTLHLVAPGDGAGAPDVDAELPATFVDDAHLTAAIDAAWITAHGGDRELVGTATVEVVSAVDGRTYASAPLAVSLQVRRALAPTGAVAPGGVVFVDDAIRVTGGGLLLGGAEGTTVATVTGCFQPDGASACTPVAAQTLTVTPDDLDADDPRAAGSFPFAPAIAGIQPGTFTGAVTLANRPAAGAATTGPAQPRSFQLTAPAIFHVSPAAASLGQYVDVAGGGFVGGSATALTELHVVGQLAIDGAAPAPVDLVLLPEVVSGRVARYVVSTDDALGHALDLRAQTATLTGTVTPVVRWGGDTVTGAAAPLQLAIAPVRQVVYLSFTPSYVESLRRLGLRAVDRAVRDRIVAVVRAAYPAVNLDVRVDPVTDFALYSTVEITGPDPNGLGLFGYDNSPGKDVGNLRLYDQLGGVNAVTQQDGAPGYGGVFVESLLGFSLHPPAGFASGDGADAAFDAIFDPLRPDGGAPITADDLAGGVPAVADAATCPAADRPGQIACAIRVLGSLLGGTIAHEVGHSLGLANPYGDGYHDVGDRANRLMDAGGDRPFLERAELGGQGPAVFCADEYAYLRQILPTAAPADPSPRPACD